VQCTGQSYSACGQDSGTPLVCDSRRRTCSTEKKGSATPCQRCVSDAECSSPLLCMPMTFGTSAEIGTFCLWPQAATGTGAPNGACTNVREYVATETGWTSLDGTTPVAVCKPATTTCQGLSDYRQKSCSGSDAAGHAMCGADGVDDGLCVPWNASYACSYHCAGYQDCTKIGSRPQPNTECQNVSVGGQFTDICVFE
jgi:hypothetical protein